MILKPTRAILFQLGGLSIFALLAVPAGVYFFLPRTMRTFVSLISGADDWREDRVVDSNNKTISKTTGQSLESASWASWGRHRRFGTGATCSPEQRWFSGVRRPRS